MTTDWLEVHRSLRRGSMFFNEHVIPPEEGHGDRAGVEQLHAYGMSGFYMPRGTFARFELEALELGLEAAGRSVHQDEFPFWFWDDVWDLLHPRLGPDAPEELDGVTLNGEPVRVGDWEGGS